MSLLIRGFGSSILLRRIIYFLPTERKWKDYGAVQLIGTSSEASKYKCEFKLRAANGIEQISKTFLVHGYSEDFETTFNSGKCLNLDEATMNLFVEEHKNQIVGNTVHSVMTCLANCIRLSQRWAEYCF